MLTPTQAKSKLINFKDKDFRKHQESAIGFIINSDRKFKVLESPTGSGKSLISITSGVCKGDFTYLCSSKTLQTQITTDFPETKSLWGRNNYICLANQSQTCEECFSTKINPCYLKSECLYKVAKKKVLKSNYRILNYSYFLSEIQYAGQFSGFPFTIVDEVDALESTLINHVSLTFTERSMYRLGLDIKNVRKTATSQSGVSTWIDFATEAMVKSKAVYKKLEKEISEYDENIESWQLQKIKERDMFMNLYRKCKMFISNVDKDWLMEETERSGSRQSFVTFRPLWITKELADSFLWSHSDSWLLMSATLLPKPVFCKTLGIDEDEVDWMTVPSTFPVENRPVHIWPVADVVNKNMELAVPELSNAVSKILTWHKGQRGLIHGVSFSLCNKIANMIDSPRIKIHDSSNKQEILDSFIATSDDSVIISPSMERGVSLNDNKCSFIICLKAPFLNLADKVVNKRLYSGTIGQLWYRANMMLTIVQACGRGCRHENDKVVCYLIDEQINKVYSKYPLLWPKWFSDAVSWDENRLVGE